MAAATPASTETLHVIGFGSVGQAMYKTLGVVISKGQFPASIGAIKYRAPEIKEERTDGLFHFAPGPFVTRDTLVPLLDSVSSGRRKRQQVEADARASAAQLLRRAGAARRAGRAIRDAGGAPLVAPRAARFAGPAFAPEAARGPTMRRGHTRSTLVAAASCRAASWRAPLRPFRPAHMPFALPAPALRPRR